MTCPHQVYIQWCSNSNINKLIYISIKHTLYKVIYGIKHTWYKVIFVI